MIPTPLAGVFYRASSPTSVSFVKAATRGTLYAEAREQAFNPRLASYSVQITDDVNDVVEPIQRIVILLICFKLYYISKIINIMLNIYIKEKRKIENPPY